MNRSLLVHATILVVCTLASGCKRDPPEPYTLAAGSTVTLGIAVSERVEYGGRAVAKRLELSLIGVADAQGLDLRIELPRLVYTDSDGLRETLAATDTATESADLTSLQRARLRILNALVDRPVRAGLNGTDGLVNVEGLDAALREATLVAVREEHPGDPIAAAVDAASDGLVALLDDTAVLRGLRSAGLKATPAGLPAASTSIVRELEIHVDGRGAAAVSARGESGPDHDGSPVVRVEGRGSSQLAFAGPTGVAPPDEIGEILLESLEARAETLHEFSTLRPLRGNTSLVYMHARGPKVERRVSFTLVVTP